MKKLIELFNIKYGKKHGIIDDDFTPNEMYEIYNLIKAIGSENNEILERLSKIKLDVVPTPSNIMAKDICEKMSTLPYLLDKTILDKSNPKGTTNIVGEDEFPFEIPYFDINIMEISASFPQAVCFIKYEIRGVEQELIINKGDIDETGHYEKYYDDSYSNGIVLTILPCGQNLDKMGILIMEVTNNSEEFGTVKEVTMTLPFQKNIIRGNQIEKLSSWKIDFSDNIVLNSLLQKEKLPLSVNEYYGLHESILEPLTQSEANQFHENIPHGGKNNYYIYIEKTNTHCFNIESKESEGWKGIKIENAKTLFTDGTLTFDYVASSVRIIVEVTWNKNEPPTIDSDVTYTNPLVNLKTQSLDISISQYVKAFKVNVYILFTQPNGVNCDYSKVTNLRLVKRNTMLSRHEIPTKTSQLIDDIGFINEVPLDEGVLDNTIYMPTDLPNIPSEITNYIIIKHSDNSYALYSVIADKLTTDEIVITNDKSFGKVLKLKTSGSPFDKYTITNGEWVKSKNYYYFIMDDVINVITNNFVFKDMTTTPITTYEIKYSNIRIEKQQLRGTTEEIKNYVGKEGQIIVNKDTHSICVMDGVTQGGHDLKEYINTMISFNELGELVVTINGLSKTFIPKA